MYYVKTLLTIGMPYFCNELHFRRPKGVFFRKIQVAFEKASFTERKIQTMSLIRSPRHETGYRHSPFK